jgi:hypothetical protein
VLDVETRIHIKDLCYDTKDDGVTPYWNCLNDELKKIYWSAQPDLDVLDVETRIHIKDLCYDTKDDGVTPYWNCLRKQLKEIGMKPTEKAVVSKTVIETQEVQQEQLNTIDSSDDDLKLTSKPDLGEVHELDAIIIEGICEISKPFGIQKYWGCLHRQIEESKSLVRPDFSDVDEETGEIILNFCQLALIAGIEGFYGCLNKQLESIGK